MHFAGTLLILSDTDFRVQLAEKSFSDHSGIKVAHRDLVVQRTQGEGGGRALRPSSIALFFRQHPKVTSVRNLTWTKSTSNKLALGPSSKARGFWRATPYRSIGPPYLSVWTHSNARREIMDLEMRVAYLEADLEGAPVSAHNAFTQHRSALNFGLDTHSRTRGA